MLSLKRKTWRSTILNRSYAQNKEWSVVSRKWTGDQHQSERMECTNTYQEKKSFLMFSECARHGADCVMMLSKFYEMILSKLCQIIVHVLIEMLLKYNGKLGYTHKVLKKLGIYLQGQNCLL